jgi:FAD/FMN-containing dehydrogenase
MIDCSRMKSVRVDRANRVAVADPGVTLGEFDRSTTSENFVTTMGMVSKTGIAGLTLGGGLGWLMGRFGLACDNLIAAEVVTADGRVVRASEKENEDLLWGLRGGGGNFGIVTRFEYRLHPLEPTTGGLLLYPLERGADVLRHFRDITRSYPDELSVVQGLLNAPDGSPVAALGVNYCGEVAAAETALRPVRACGTPVADTVATSPYTQLQSMMDEAYPSGLYYYWKSGMMDTLNDAAIPILLHYFRTRPSPLTQMFFEHIHGAAARVPQQATAFAHRRELFNFTVLAFWKDAAESDANLAWLQSFWKDFQPHLGRGAYVNYLSQEGPERVRDAYGPNYQRLVALKRKYDPTNFFRYNQNISPV